MNELNLSELSIREKVGQLFFIGIRQTVPDDLLEELLEEIKPGGVCLFARNLREALQTRELTEFISNQSSVVPFISVDQEGGLVDRLRKIIAPMPAPSKFTDKLEIEHFARLTAEILKILGFNMNFAPVVDIISGERAKFSNGLYSRVFGSNALETIEFSKAYLEQLQANGIIGCLKHFPGLGGAEIDSHEELPSVNLTDEEIEKVDLEPYRQLFKTANVPVLMAAHAAFPNSKLQERDQNGKLLPSSLSSAFLKNLLRSQLGYQNLVITDDLEMGAIVKNYGIGEACKMAISAGEDMVLICSDPQAVRQGFEAILTAVENAEISVQRLDESLARINSVKKQISAPVDFSAAKLAQFSQEINGLNQNFV